MVAVGLLRGVQPQMHEFREKAVLTPPEGTFALQELLGATQGWMVSARPRLVLMSMERED